MKRFAAALALSSLISAPAFAAIEIDENENFGPTFSSTIADITVGKPLQVANALLGTAVHIVGLPFSSLSNSTDESYDLLVAKPWNALRRCNGCTPIYDDYIKAKENTPNQVRFMVDGPSEIIITTDDQVIVNK